MRCLKHLLPRRHRHGATWSSRSPESIFSSVLFVAAARWRGVPFATAPQARGPPTHHDPLRFSPYLAARPARSGVVRSCLVHQPVFTPVPTASRRSAALLGTFCLRDSPPSGFPSSIQKITFCIAPNPRPSSTWVCWKDHRHCRANVSSRWTTPASRAIIHSSKPY